MNEVKWGRHQIFHHLKKITVGVRLARSSISKTTNLPKIPLVAISKILNSRYQSPQYFCSSSTVFQKRDRRISDELHGRTEIVGSGTVLQLT
ncbi:hypothetical protein TNCV_287001 [Trichonephila clavipes]|nr:hypothetical protein TNCV_287001 [Trichonephila clavipes]